MMRARVVVFPIKGRNWCFSRSIDNSLSDISSANNPSTFKHLWYQLRSPNSTSNGGVNPLHAKSQLLIDFVANKMNAKWLGLENAPHGSFKNKLHGLGLKLLSRVKPSEIFLRSITNEVTNLDIIYPLSSNARLVRRRLRHIAMRGTIIHKKYFYGSVALIPLTSILSVLPLPNIALLWNLFRTYSHWRALKGSEKLLQLVSNDSDNHKAVSRDLNGCTTDSNDDGTFKPIDTAFVLLPSKKLDELLHAGDKSGCANGCAISDICKTFDLNKNDVLKYKYLM